MTDILVVGGGFAGVWAAASAARLRQKNSGQFSIALACPGRDLVMRPRLYEAEPQNMAVPLARILKPIDVNKIDASVIEIDQKAKAITLASVEGKKTQIVYRKLVLASGSQIQRPGFAGAGYLHDVDTMEGAIALDRHIHQLPRGVGRFTAVVVGAGFTGLEIATELVERLRAIAARLDASSEVRVVLVDVAPVVGPELGSGPRPTILAALNELNVELKLDAKVAAVSADSVEFDDGARIPTQTVVWTAGIFASPLTQFIEAERDKIGRIFVDDYLKIPTDPSIYVAGDTAAARAEEGHYVLPSCQHAIPMGKYAGYNAAAGLLGLDPVEFKTSPYATCLDLGGAGAVLTNGWERVVEKTGEAAKAHKRRTNQQRIYPPLDDAADILRAADFNITTRQPQPAAER
ncbi:NADH dehydrogenase [Beijerinckia sp. 28-YEA-48]|nr:NADH dehydrogenase [Beijerinckia sp. 28-YEA-48]